MCVWSLNTITLWTLYFSQLQFAFWIHIEDHGLLENQWLQCVLNAQLYFSQLQFAFWIHIEDHGLLENQWLRTLLKLDSIYMYVTNYLFNDKYKHVGIRYYLLYGLHVVVNVQNVFVWYFLTSLTVNNQYWLFSSFNKCLKSHQYVVSDPTQETK